MLKKIFKALKRGKAVAYVATLKKQLKRLESRHEKAKGADRGELQRRVNRKRIAVERAVAHLGTLCFLVLLGCAHGPRPVDAIETAVIVSEAALEVCERRHKSDAWDGSQRARDARAACLQVEDIDRARDATTALDDAVEAMAEWIKTGA